MIQGNRSARKYQLQVLALVVPLEASSIPHRVLVPVALQLQLQPKRKLRALAQVLLRALLAALVQVPHLRLASE